MSFFSGKTTMTNKSAIPAGITREAAIALLHDHDFFIHCDPHYTSHKSLPQPSGAVEADLNAAKKHFKLPDTITKSGSGAGLTIQGVPIVKLYEVTDDLPNPVWNSTVVSGHEMVDLEAGLWTRVKSPMGVTMETTWQIVEIAGAPGTYEIVQEALISASKLIMGFVKAQIENNRGGIHKKMIAKLEADRDGVAVPAAAAAEGEAAPAVA